MELVDVSFCTGKEIVSTKNFVALLQQMTDQMRTDKAGAARNQDALSAVV